MKAFLTALASIWGSWFVALVATSVYADVSADGNASIWPYLVFYLGFLLCAIATVVSFAGIAGAQCLEAQDRRHDRPS